MSIVPANDGCSRVLRSAEKFCELGEQGEAVGAKSPARSAQNLHLRSALGAPVPLHKWNFSSGIYEEVLSYTASQDG